MKSRQRGALAHPIAHGDNPIPHKNRVETIGNRRSILTVYEFMPDSWIWQSSFSYQRPAAGPLPLEDWTLSQARKADRELRSVLDGVGDAFVFGIKPSAIDLESWKELDLEPWEVINDDKAVAHVAKSLGYDLPCPPSRFHAMHLWKSLTDAEVADALAALGGSLN